ncbi:TolC family protein [Larkinella arboricola]|uniref:Outer membrane protein TolC n=1 Tax=Larkinella arboricola TaxID=643671 RepID=A0A327WT57_LARAB|nr:TolC family protein [Larkinella arboricola]RAJ95550.1 outer membrane protein TolC [Larkinella arboricola]
MRFFLSLSLCLSFLTAWAQPTQSLAPRLRRNSVVTQEGSTLTLQEAISAALDKSYQIRIFKSQEQIARTDFKTAKASFFPFVTGNLTNNNNLQNLRQEFLDGLRPPQNLYGITNRNTQVGLGVNWMVFNGFGNFITYDRLGEVVKISEANTRASIETTVADVATAYYDVIRQLQQLLSLRQALDISRERLELARTNFEVGTRSRADFLTAQVDYNADSSALVTQQQNVRNSKIFLNTLLVRDPATEFAVRDTIIVRTDISLDQLRQSLGANNPQLIAASLNRRVADLNVRLARSTRLPVVNVVGGYNFTAINNQGGFGVRSARNDALVYGVQASVPIFTGFNQRRLIANAQTSALITEYQESDQRLQLQQALEQTYSQYRNNLILVNLELESFKIANQNVDIAFERYRVGNSTPVEFRDVQRNAVAAETRLINAEFNAKVAEIELLRLSSQILQQTK